MPNHKSCKKRMKTSERDRVKNRGLRSELRGVIKELRAEKSAKSAAEKLSEVTRELDRAAARGLIHKRNADRNKSRLTQFVNSLA